MIEKYSNGLIHIHSIGRSRIHLQPGGGGAGGLLVNNDGPSARKGESFGGADGGSGFGAGGGSGFTAINENADQSNSIHYAGGDGADGLVYVEWNERENQAPASITSDYGSLFKSLCIKYLL